ncbi:MAG: alpha/beta hydrolase [Rhodospirillales bacterium]|nr:alpha/beta hydrolase [Rhodospirillales bacterium]
MPEVIFNGTEGRLEGRYHHSKTPNAPLALILHPHSRHGGSMNNRVVFALFQEFQRRGFSALRFNFRGVGRSQGRFDNGQGELSDGASALDWMESINPNASECWIAGYSFGAWIGMQLMMRRPEINRFIAVAPPAGLHDFTFLAPCPASGLILHGADDTTIPPAAVAKLVQKLSQQKNIKIEYRTLPGVDHFFQTHVEDVAAAAAEYMDRVQAQPA